MSLQSTEENQSNRATVCVQPAPEAATGERPYTSLASLSGLSSSQADRAPCEASSEEKHSSGLSTSRGQITSTRLGSVRDSLPKGSSLQSVELDRGKQRNTGLLGSQVEEPDAYLLKLLRQGASPGLQSISDSQQPRPRKRPRTSTAMEQPSLLRTFSKTCSAPVEKSFASLPGASVGSESLGMARNSQRPSEILRSALGDEQFSGVRAAVLKHQEVFLGQLYELHRMVQLQRHLVSVCDKPEAVTAELAKLEAEQYLRHQASSDVTVEQVGHVQADGRSTEAADASLQQPPGPPPEVPAQDAPPEPQHPSGFPQLPSRPPHPNMPYAGYGPGVWPGIYGRGYSMPYGPGGMGLEGFPGWGMPMMNGGFPGTFANPYGGSMGMMGGPHMDPMMAWYMMHYGQYAQAMHSAANARMHAPEQQQNAAEAAAWDDTRNTPQARENIRWWQDPEKVFGVAANPAVIARPSSSLQPSQKHDLQTEAISKPKKLKRTSANDSTHVPSGQAGRPPNVANQTGVSRGSEPLPSAEATQKTGSGVSAFKKLPTKSPNLRRPPTRAESIGSEVSRSAAERSPVDEGESSGVAHGVAKA